MTSEEKKAVFVLVAMVAIFVPWFIMFVAYTSGPEPVAPPPTPTASESYSLGPAPRTSHGR